MIFTSTPFGHLKMQILVSIVWKTCHKACVWMSTGEGALRTSFLLLWVWLPGPWTSLGRAELGVLRERCEDNSHRLQWGQALLPQGVLVQAVPAPVTAPMDLQPCLCTALPGPPGWHPAWPAQPPRGHGWPRHCHQAWPWHDFSAWPWPCHITTSTAGLPSVSPGTPCPASPVGSHQCPEKRNAFSGPQTGSSKHYAPQQVLPSATTCTKGNLLPSNSKCKSLEERIDTEISSLLKDKTNKLAARVQTLLWRYKTGVTSQTLV